MQEWVIRFANKVSEEVEFSVYLATPTMVGEVGLWASSFRGLPMELRTRFSLCRLLQNHTLTTSLSKFRASATEVISLELGFGCEWKCLSSVSLAPTPIEVRRFLFLSGDCSSSFCCTPCFSASSSHFSKIGFNF